MVASESPTRSTLGPGDAAGALALSDAAGWNQTADDWRVFLKYGRVEGVHDHTGRLVASAAALPYGDDQGWISMVLVDAAWRHRGLATELLSRCVDCLRAQNLTPVLDATPAGEPVYRRLGFATGLAFERWQAELPTGACATPANARVMVGAEVDVVVALDRAANRIDRRYLIEAFLARPGTRGWMTHDRSGFIICREGRRAVQIGPLIAADAAAAVALLDAALSNLRGPVFLDAVTHHEALLAALIMRRFTRQRPFVRMALGDATAQHGGAHQFLVAGPEFG